VLPPALEVLTAWSIAETEADPAAFRQAMDRAIGDAVGSTDPLRGLAHMGTQFGVIDRIIMTTGVLLLLTSIATSFVMWWLRRPSSRARICRIRRLRSTFGLPPKRDTPA
jgi:uncharacterized iron-regulated membrane protein